MKAPQSTPPALRCIRKTISPRLRTLAQHAALALAFLAPAAAHAALSNVIVWNSARKPANLNTTRTAAPTSTSGMQLWWKCDSTANLGWDSIGVRGSFFLARREPQGHRSASLPHRGP